MRGVLFDEYGLGGTGGRMSPLSWILVALSWIGAFAVGKWSRDQLSMALSILDAWATERAHNLCGQAILDYEFDRGVDGLTAWEYAHRMM